MSLTAADIIAIMQAGGAVLKIFTVRGLPFIPRRTLC